MVPIEPERGRYNDAEPTFGSAWLAPGYNDAAWPRPGPECTSTLARSPRRRANTRSPASQSYYFRASL